MHPEGRNLNESNGDRNGIHRVISESPLIPIAVILLTAGLALNAYRQQRIVDQCKTLTASHTFKQLKACNSFLRRKELCVIPSEGARVDRSCFDKEASENFYRTCVDDQEVWGKAVETRPAYIAADIGL